ncbi:hypothetical protein ACFSBX_14935 [Halobellus rarus]|uniref:Uncharacterized protein n=1 Tax=Halobellus rarus TaxID=1126237 RepID=A0ABD6CPZ8_9EURY
MGSQRLQIPHTESNWDSAKERAQELATKTDELIGEIVYELYGLTDEDHDTIRL